MPAIESPAPLQIALTENYREVVSLSVDMLAKGPFVSVCVGVYTADNQLIKYEQAPLAIYETDENGDVTSTLTAYFDETITVDGVSMKRFAYLKQVAYGIAKLAGNVDPAAVIE